MKLYLLLVIALLYVNYSVAATALKANAKFAYNSIKEALLNAKPEELDGTFDISDKCAINLSYNLQSCESTVTTLPGGCLSVADMIPGDSIPGLDKFANTFKVNHASINICQKTLEFSTSMVPGEEINIIPGVLAVFDFTVKVSYNHAASPKVTGEVEGTFMIGQMKFTVKVTKSTSGYAVTGTPERKALSVSYILSKLASHQFPADDLSKAFKAVGLNSVSITQPKLLAVMPGGGKVGIQFSFNVQIPNFGSTKVYLTYNQLSSADKGVYLALIFPTVTLPKVVAKLTGNQVDISSVPFFGTMQVNHPGFVFASKSMSTLVFPFSEPSLDLLENLKFGVTVAFSAEVNGDNPANFVLTYAPATKRLNFKLQGLKPKVSSLLKQLTSKLGSVQLPPKFNIDDFLGKALEHLSLEGKVLTIPVPLGRNLPLISTSVVLVNPELTFQIKIGSTNLGVHLKTGIRIGSVHVSLEIRKPQGSNMFIAYGKSNVEIPIGSMIAKLGKTILPVGPLKDAIDKAGFDKFKIVKPEISVMFGKTYAMRIQGTAMVGTMEASTVQVLFGKESGTLVMATGVVLHKTPVTQIIKKLTGNIVDLTVVPGARILDGTKLAVVIASNGIPKNHDVLSFTQDPLSRMKVNAGVSVIGHFYLPENCGGDKGCTFLKKFVLEKFPSLIIRGTISVSQVTVEALIADPLVLASGLTLKDMGLKIEVGQARNAVGVQCSLEVTGFPLVFEGQLGISTSGAFVAVSFKNWWKKAFGLDFLSIGNLNLRVAGMTDPFLINEIELGGQMRLGYEDRASATPIEATLYGGISRVNPAQNYIYVKLSALTIAAFAKAFAFKLNLPSPIANTGFPDGVTISYSQIERTVGEISIPRGFRLKGLLKLAYIGKFDCDVVVDVNGIKIDLTATKINIGGSLVVIEGANSNSKGPKLHVDLTWSPPKSLIEISGKVAVLGISRTVSVFVDHQKMYFSISGSIFGLFQAEISMSATYGDVKKMNFMVNAKFKNDLIDKLRSMVQRAIKNFADTATREINKAKAGVENAKKAVNRAANDLASKQREVDKFQGDVNRAKNKVASQKAVVERAKKHFDAVNARLGAAKRSVDHFQSKVDGAARNVQSKKAAVKRAQNHLNAVIRTLESKKADVDRAVRKFDDAYRHLQREKNRFGRCRRRRSIDDDEELDLFAQSVKARQFLQPKKRWGRWRAPRIRIKSPVEIAKEIARKARERGRELLCRGYRGVLSAAQRVVGAAGHAVNLARHALTVAQGVVNGARHSLNVAKGALDAAAATARGFGKSLDVAKHAVTGLQKTVDAAKGSLDAAKAVLFIAEQTLNGFKHSLNAAKGVLVGLAQAVKAAGSTLDAAKGTLEAVNQAQKLGAKAASLITKGLLGGIINIREMTSRVRLSAMQGGSFTGSVSAAFFDGPVQKFSFTINLRSPGKMAEFLIKKAKKALESLVG